MGYLQNWINAMTEEERKQYIGCENADPLTGAFPGKRTVHAGWTGRPVPQEEQQDRWQAVMKGLPQGSPRGTVYIHIPFCRTHCLYCGFYQNSCEEQAEHHYVDSLIRELQQESLAPRLQNSVISAVFIGGGTPSSLPAEDIRRLLQTVRQCLPLSSDCEVTLEGRVHDLVPEKMELWMRGGVNRVSLGIQSFHPQIRRMMGRIDDQETVMKRMEQLKSYGKCTIIADLIYGLPGQTAELWEQDLSLLESSGADGMDLYQLDLLRGSPLEQKLRAGQLPQAAGTAEKARMYQAALAWLGKRSFRRLSVRHWARTPGERSLYNGLARSSLPLFPFGSGAGGHAGGYGVMLQRSLISYEESISRREKPLLCMAQQPWFQAIGDQVVQQMEQGLLDMKSLTDRDGRLSEVEDLLRLWEQRGLMTDNGVLRRLTAAGEFWQVNLLQSILDSIRFLLGDEPETLQQNQGQRISPVRS